MSFTTHPETPMKHPLKVENSSCRDKGRQSTCPITLMTSQEGSGSLRPFLTTPTYLHLDTWNFLPLTVQDGIVLTRLYLLSDRSTIRNSD